MLLFYVFPIRFYEIDYNLLKKLGTSRDDWHVKVRVFRLWEAVNVNNSNKLISLDMILLDEQVLFLNCEISAK